MEKIQKKRGRDTSNGTNTVFASLKQITSSQLSFVISSGSSSGGVTSHTAS